MSTRKEKSSSGQSQLAPSGFLRPSAGWKKAGVSLSDGTKSKVPDRFSMGSVNSKTDCRAGGRVPIMPSPRRSHTIPESEKRSLLQAVNKFTTSEISEPSVPTTQAPSRDIPSRDAPAQAILCSDKRPSVPVPLSEENILSVQRKVTSTMNELVNNKDYKHQVKSGLRGMGDSRGDSKDDHMTKERDYRLGEREKFDQSKLDKLMSRKDKGSSGQSQLPPTGFLRPAAGWKKADSLSSDGTKSRVIPRSFTSSGSKSKIDSRIDSRVPTMQGARRLHTTPYSERESLLQAVNKFTTSEMSEPSAPTTQAPFRNMPSRNMPFRDVPAQTILCSRVRQSVPVPMSEENILSVQRKVTSTIDELVNNKDYKEAIECVKEIDLPGAMKQVVVEGINHTLEQKAVYRPVTGQLFSRLVQEKAISQHDFTDGLIEVLEIAEDMCIDIPEIWDYLGEVLCPVFAHKHIPMSAFKKSLPPLLESVKASVLVAKLLSCCRSELKGEEEVKRLWSRCGLEWEDLGVHRKDLEEFLDRKELSFLLASKSPVATRELPQSLLESLHSMLVATDSTIDDINQWIKKNCASQGYDPALLVTNLTSAVVQASVSGIENDAVLNHDQFEQRMEVVKTQDHYGVAVLHGLQYSVAKLSYPPKLIRDLFNIVYDLDLVDEQEFYTWREDDQVMYGKGTALASVKPFFDWLKGNGSSEQT